MATPFIVIFILKHHIYCTEKGDNMKSKILIALSGLLILTLLNNEVQAENIQKGITVDI
ncbi:hypothetical protein [Mammaliicoccus sciuri]|uniref:hypothetical protein n=1 Tax=Mammaliicoccus sciuri TaxID=1296 RepID=UPI000AED736A|nr:hypothetical protein [Mammaliicoccus sciuri]